MSMDDWRGNPLQVGDTVVFPYSWGGVPLAMCEGVIIEFSTDSPFPLAKVDLHYDNGAYPRKRLYAWAKPERMTKVEPR